MSEKQKATLAVIDLSTSTLHLMKVDDGLDGEQIEEYLVDSGFKLSQVSWGVIESIEID